MKNGHAHFYGTSLHSNGDLSRSNLACSLLFLYFSVPCGCSSRLGDPDGRRTCRAEANEDCLIHPEQTTLVIFKDRGRGKILLA